MIHLNAQKLRVLVCHPEPLLAIGLAAALRQGSEFDVQTSDSQAPSGAGSCHDIIVTDYQGGLAMVKRKSSSKQPPRALVVTAHDREQEIRTALEAGVHGYLLLGCPLNELVVGARALGRGMRYVSSAAAQRMADSLTREALTTREADVLQLLARGHSNKSIARDLEIAVGTVKSHLRAIMNKLDTSSRTEAVSVAMQRGLVDEPAAFDMLDARSQAGAHFVHSLEATAEH